MLVAFSATAFAQARPPDVTCKKTETQPECHARLKCKKAEELEDCQKRLLRCKAGEKAEDCERRAYKCTANENVNDCAKRAASEPQGGQQGQQGAGQQGNAGQQDANRQPNEDQRGDQRGRENEDQRGRDRNQDNQPEERRDRAEQEREQREREQREEQSPRRRRGGGDDEGDRGGRRRGRPAGGGGGGGGGFEANKTFGLGLELGEPTGLNGKYFLSPAGALDFGLGWIYRHYYYGDGFHIYADYLWHPISLVHAAAFELPLYIGGGLRYWNFHYYCAGRICDYYGSAFGIRIPIGISFDFNNLPLDIFLQAVPTIDFLYGDYYDRYRDRAHLGVDFSFGIRFWFK